MTLTNNSVLTMTADPSRFKISSDFEAQVVSSANQIQDVMEEWRDFLEQDASKVRIRQDPRLLLSRLERNPNESPLVILLRKSGFLQCVAVCVVIETRLDLHFSVFKVPTVKVRMLKVLDSDFVLAKNANDTECISLMFEFMKSLDHRFDLIYLEHLRLEGPIYAYFETGNGLRNQDLELILTSVTIEKIHKHVLGDTYENWLMSLRKRSRNKIRQSYKRLLAGFDEDIKLEKATSVSDIADFQVHLNEIYPKTWQAKVLGPKQRRVERDTVVFHEAATNGWFRSYLMRVKGRVVAFETGYQYSNVYVASEGGYDPEYASWGVGSILMQLILQDLYAANRPTEYNLGFGDNEYKWAISNNVQDASQAYICRHGLAARLIRAQKALSKLEAGARQALIKTGLIDLVRKILKKKPT